MILVAVEDLIFLSKIQQAARLLDLAVEPVDLGEVEARVAQPPVHAVILDLNHRSGAAVEILRVLKANPATRHIEIAGFLSHVQGDLAAAARAAGCDWVLARSAFSRQLPQLLCRLAGRGSPATPEP